jgi:hypothetical protein
VRGHLSYEGQTESPSLLQEGGLGERGLNKVDA